MLEDNETKKASNKATRIMKLALKNQSGVLARSHHREPNRNKAEYIVLL